MAKESIGSKRYNGSFCSAYGSFKIFFDWEWIPKSLHVAAVFRDESDIALEVKVSDDVPYGNKRFNIGEVVQLCMREVAMPVLMQLVEDLQSTDKMGDDANSAVVDGADGVVTTTPTTAQTSKNGLPHD